MSLIVVVMLIKIDEVPLNFSCVLVMFRKLLGTVGFLIPIKIMLIYLVLKEKYEK